MKKSIQYAGIAAATLLAVSPIGVVLLDPITTVRADITAPDSTDMQSYAKEMGDTLEGQKLQYDFNKYTGIQKGLDDGYALATSKNITDGSILISPKGTTMFNFSRLLGNATPSKVKTKVAIKNLDDGSVYYTLKIFDPDGNQVKTATDLDNAIKNDNLLKNYKVDMGLAYANDTSGTSFTELSGAKGLDIVDFSDIASANLELGPSEITVKQGSSVADIDGTNFGATVVDNNGVQIGKSTESTTYNYYASFEDANNAINIDLPSGTAITPDPVDVGNTFNTPGTYYRDVGITMSGAADQYMINYVNEQPGVGDLTVNGVAASKEVVNPGQDYYLGGSNGYDYIQKVIVTPSGNTGSSTSNTGSETNNSISGIATTHTDQKSYALYNDDNVKIDNRALMANSSWQVDGIRTVKGVKQYRVSTHEWVNASDVDFIENGSINEEMSVKKLDTPKEISLATNHKIYNLQSSKRVVSTTRALAGGTSWLVDKIGTDMHGGIYYGVSTDEFVKASDGVNVVK
ncbi:hypothetical protein [Companilactobacillus keshanensis]|uniref:Surface layer protein A domain-containing protein n=1 Tax=Companilactobacillus keshanensis TaxID=2486003 RepID=A0ABW4BSZ2_9LACO|nr:hypothetical protein [Companilactobacillus keshanensis]